MHQMVRSRATNNLETQNNMGHVVRRGTCNNMESMSDDSETEEPSDYDIEETQDDAGSTRKKTRGRTRLQWLHLQKEPIQVKLNELRQPIGEPGKQLGQYIDFIISDSTIIPLTFEDWRHMPKETKFHIYDIIKAKFNIDWDLAEDWINKKIDHLWRQRKHKLKKEYEKPSKDKEKIAKLINDVGQVQWDWLVKFWNSEKGKDRAKTNKQNYGKLEMHHNGGTKSFARLRDELKKQDPEGNEPNKITIFKATHTRKNDKPIDPKVANAMRQMDELVINQPDTSKNEIFNQVMGEVIGPKADVSTLTYGLGITRSKKNGKRSSHIETLKTLQDERIQREAANEKIKHLETELISMKSQLQTVEEMKA
ncbi:hypothetical protein LWI29_007385 [Acer saccharum]|uniref:Transposase, Ptta/En/Spm, plant n=1 Tax=Acer saccharum TaxID=4024 RepID=A0AA39RCT9_ACESA|nr:hypothetical protein LWI29_007385 [Acer saccharum]